MALWHTLFGCLIWQQLLRFHTKIWTILIRFFQKQFWLVFFPHFLRLFKAFVIKLFSWIFHALELSLLFAVLVEFFFGWNTFFSFCNARLSTKRPIKLGSSNCITTTVSAIYFCHFFVGPSEIWNNHLKYQRQANHFFPQHLGFESRG